MDKHERIRHEHAELRLVCDRLRAMVAAAAATLEEPRWHALWAREIDQLQELLVEHFRNEEEGGYMVEVLAVAPNHNHKVETLLGEHAVMLKRVGELAGQARQDVDHDTYGDRVMQLLGMLTTHEQTETSLWQATLWTDIGAGD
jgi:hypothetical protein